MAKQKPQSNKTKCPFKTRKEFADDAKPVELVIAGQTFHADLKGKIGEGSLGWYLNEKVTVKVGDKLVKCQIGLNLTVVNSKDLKADPALDEEPEEVEESADEEESEDK